ncbi:TonB-dependent receptor [Novosphingobium kunmingense]|uniref:TonB-dependent receptor n=1 Tax=Novosphingobium kunmingense TaxID=1211806 RepID=A0A2N0HJK8_9SPHN|nr:TonB-dependent receptor [Novosphingobium kunmingense]PKB19055.1 TonB-dependent receptor [Novosphingobium kunmingense]
MKTPLRLVIAALTTTALTSPGLALAQTAETAPEQATPPADDPAAAADAAQQDSAESPPVEVSAPGGEIVVTGRRNRNIERSAPQVVSVLSSADIARTGEGNIAGALGRVTGLSVVGSGYVYVRGLGDRYSLALLNGSPLPSPEPLKRVVPLDLFPSSVIASSLVQKSYSANYPGEFGGGVINLTTKAIPRDPFLSIGVGVSGDTYTTGNLGYTYYGSGSDWTGFDSGARNIPPALASFLASGERISSGNVDTGAIARELVTGNNAAIQRWRHIPANFSGSISGAKSWELGETNLGLIGAIGYSNKWQTRQPHQQRSLSADISTIESDFTGLNTENRVVLNGLLGIGLEFGENKIRWTNLGIHDTVKYASLSLGQLVSQSSTVDRMRQRTAWYERQLLSSQLVGEFKLTPDVSLDVRGGFANSKRKAPFELYFEYIRTNAAPADPLGDFFVNRLNNGNGGDASVTFSDLNEDLWSASADLSWRAVDGLTLTAGGAFSDTQRTSSRRQFQFLAPAICEGVPSPTTVCLPAGVTLQRPDFLLGANKIDAFGISLIESDEGNPAFLATLRNAAGYGKANFEIVDGLTLDAGVRYEWAKLGVSPIQVFTVPGAATTGTSQSRSYWLPAATLTWEVEPQMQVRVSASKTIARPQFRELINQPYFDPDTNREYRGNPLLIDSQLYNAEARFEWYFAPEQRFSIAGFFKRIDNPIESFISSSFITSYANAPKAKLYGAEVELKKDFSIAESGFFAARKLIVIGNYTFTKSKLEVAPDDQVQVFGAFSTLASDYFRDGAKLTGQSDHLVNFEVGFENQDKLSQQTLMVTYASDRVMSRGVFGTPPQPDVYESPGLRLDFVAREGVEILNRELELKFEARNLTGKRHIEYQRSGDNRLDINSYDVGRSFSLSATLKF